MTINLKHMIQEKTKDWLIDVPVAINFFSRPYTFLSVFNVIKEVRPRKLFLIADGPRPNVESDKVNCKLCRDIAEDVDWTCDVYKIYNNANKGLFHTYFDAMTEVFNVVEYCIFMEDDALVHPSYFAYCKELLEKYKDDERISFVTGMNVMPNGVYDDCESDYFFAGEGAIYTYGIWRRTFERMNLEFLNSRYTIDKAMDLAKLLKPGYQNRIKKLTKNPTYQGHIPHTEVYKNLLRFLYGQICIVPKRNMVRNIGMCKGATHGTDDVRKVPIVVRKAVYESTLYEMPSLMKHPKYVIEDIYYDNRCQYVFPFNRPFLRVLRIIEAVIRHLLYGDITHIANRAAMLVTGKYHD